MRFDLETHVRSLAMGLAVWSTAATGAAQSTTPVELPALPSRINNQGEIAGWVNGGAFAFAQPATYRGGAWQILSIPPGEQLGAAFDINDNGVVAGFTYFTNSPPPYPNPNPPPVVDNRWQAAWAPVGASSLQILSGLTPDSFVYAINDDEAMVGCRSRDDDDYPDGNRAFLYLAGDVTDVHAAVVAAARPSQPIPSYYDWSCALDINSAGHVVGYVSPENGPARGYLYRDGVVTLLEQDSSTYLWIAHAMNDAGRIVGEAFLPGSGASHAFVYDSETGSIASLGAESTGATASRPWDINERGDVVGALTFGPYPEPTRAFLATAGQVIVLNDLLPAGSDWFLKEARSINDQGQIVGFGYHTSSPDVERGFLLTVAFTPQQLTTILIQAVQALQGSGALNGGNANALITKLEGALAQLDKGNVGPAINTIEAFINQVQAFIQGGKLTAAQGQALINGANGIIATLTS